MMRETAKLHEKRGNNAKAVSLLEKADKMSQRILELYAGNGVWNSLYPDNKKVEVRHVLDFIYFGKYLANDVDPEIRNEMMDFLNTELRTDLWMRAQSLKDIAAKDSDRPDHGPLGSFDGWIPEVMDAMANMDYAEDALKFYHDIEPVTYEGAWAQARELWGENKLNKTAKVRIADRGWNNRESSSGIGISQVMLKNFFGFDPQINTKQPLHNYSTWPFNGQGTLHHVYYSNEYYRIEFSNEKPVMVKEKATTVSYLLNDRGDEKRVSKETQDRIKKYAKVHSYKPNQLARSLSLGKSNTIGLIVPNISDTFFAQIARRIEKKAEKLGYNVVFSSTGESPERESKIIQSILDRQVDGLIIVSSEKNEEDILKLKKGNFPFVIVGRKYTDIDTNVIALEDKKSVSSGLELLIKNGRKRIGFVTISLDLQSIKERLNGYNEVMNHHNLKIENNFIQHVSYQDVEHGIKEAIHTLIHTAKVDSILFATHYLAEEGLRVLKQTKVKITEEFAIVSFGKDRGFDLFDPPLTSVDFPIIEMGDAAVDLLLDTMEHKTTNYKNITMKTKLDIKASYGSK
jgi:LacI family transcriptional regulator